MNVMRSLWTLPLALAACEETNDLTSVGPTPHVGDASVVDARVDETLDARAPSNVDAAADAQTADARAEDAAQHDGGLFTRQDCESCTRRLAQSWCTEPGSVLWECFGAVSYEAARYLAVECRDLATGVQRWCCPAAIGPECGPATSP